MAQFIKKLSNTEPESKEMRCLYKKRFLSLKLLHFKKGYFCLERMTM